MIKNGSKVKFDYTLKVDGEVRDTSAGRGPLEYEHGAGHIIKGLEKELENMEPCQQKTVNVKPEDGYGVVNPQAKRTLPLDAVPNIKEFKVGETVTVTGGGQVMHPLISKITDKEIELDFNHPLAGKNLIFDVKIISVEE
ncbi:MAG: peptidylprolyl isomerase [Elusimicrobium sp.]|jgi:FKBP-type peptidyl-prolyl cis-trans isomerase 2|nr:peptidylprolyl isomerase [Elusimicrobium sp.]